MKIPDWIDAPTACAMLGVKPQTLYAYVSRGQIRARADRGDARRSLYARDDIDGLIRANRRPRARRDVAEAAIRWGDPVLSTAISEVRDGMLWLRGRSVADCAATLSLEDTAALLSDVAQIDTADPGPLHPGTGSGFVRAMQCLARAAADAPPMLGRTPAEIAQDAGPLLSALANACLGQPLSGPVHARFAQALGLDAVGRDAIRRALVVVSDHELNPSTFAVRVCASTGASLPAALLAGMATLSGPRHGGVADLAGAALQAAMHGDGAAFLRAQGDPYGFGFGHPLYPRGDPRAPLILAPLPDRAPPVVALHAMARDLDQPPNVDGALAALTAQLGAPAELAAMIFAVGRVAGWIAHAIEQTQSGDIIRPRARFVPTP
ncbi:MAG: citrate synthase family protein [Marinibacterium sp.]|nr:citrate synthase family protein [Marinibacterium sp.]